MAINYFALPAAAIAAFIFGGLWYGPLFSKAWLASLGKTPTELKANARPMPQLFAISLVAELLMAGVLALILARLAAGGVAPTATSGLLTGIICWLGFVASTLVVNHGYQGAQWRQTLIDAGHWLGVLAIEGLVIGAFGIRA